MMNNIEYEDVNGWIDHSTKIFHFALYGGMLSFGVSFILSIINYYLSNRIITIIILSFIGYAIIMIGLSQFIFYALQKWYKKLIFDSLNRINISGEFTFRNIIDSKKILEASGIFKPTLSWGGDFCNYIQGNYLGIEFKSFHAKIMDFEESIYTGDIFEINQETKIEFILKRKEFTIENINLTKQHTTIDAFNEQFDIYCDDNSFINNKFNFETIQALLEIKNLDFIVLNEHFFIGLKNNYEFQNHMDILLHINNDFFADFSSLNRIICLLK